MCQDNLVRARNTYKSQTSGSFWKSTTLSIAWSFKTYFESCHRRIQKKLLHSPFSVNNVDKYTTYFPFSIKAKLSLSSHQQSPYTSLLKEQKKHVCHEPREHSTLKMLLSQKNWSALNMGYGRKQAQLRRNFIKRKGSTRSSSNTLLHKNVTVK